MLSHGFKKIVWYKNSDYNYFIICATEEDLNELSCKYSNYWGSHLNDISGYEINKQSLAVLSMTLPSLNTDDLVKCVNFFNNLSYPSSSTWFAGVNIDGTVGCEPLR